jgi:hypothetical protein
VKCAWCGKLLRYVDWNSRVGQTFTCDCVFVNGRELAVPQIGSEAWQKVMAEQADPLWQPICGKGP